MGLLDELFGGDVTPAPSGLSPALQAYIPRFIQIESGGNPNARSGSYTGLLQMGPDEIAKYGGSGVEHGTRLLADRAAQLQKVLGREPSPTELYLAHQQGMGGAQAHMTNPEAPAWQNMFSTAEGRRKGEAWAKKAIWGNVPDDVKAQYPGGVDSLTSQQFMDLWRSKVERIKPSQMAMQRSIPNASGDSAPISQAAREAPQAMSPAGFAIPRAPSMFEQTPIPGMPPPIFAQKRKPIDLSRLLQMAQQTRPSGGFSI